MATYRNANATKTSSKLATPTDLEADAVRSLTEAINVLLADAYVLYVKTKNFHWHLSGPHFRDYHLLFDEQAEELFESFDPLAERVRRIGGTTIRSISHINRLQSLSDDNDAFVSADDMVLRLLADNQHMAKALRATMELAEEKHDGPTSNLLQELLDQTEKRVWFLHEISVGGRNGS